MASPTGPSRHEGSTSTEVLPSPSFRADRSIRVAGPRDQAEVSSVSRPEMPRLPISYPSWNLVSTSNSLLRSAT